MKNAIFISAWGGKVLFARSCRRDGLPVGNPPAPEGMSATDRDWCLKLVAHWAGGPLPAAPDAEPLELHEKFVGMNQ